MTVVCLHRQFEIFFFFKKGQLLAKKKGNKWEFTNPEIKLVCTLSRKRSYNFISDGFQRDIYIK